ncbi:MAG: ABC transporter permease, partial [Chloroflexota bacterium]
MNLGRQLTLRRALLWMWPAVPVLAALLFTSVLLLLFDTSPRVAFEAMLQGAAGDTDKRLSMLAFWVPLFLASSGLLITFRAGLWNIGIEGQIILGAIAASWVALKVDAPGPVLIFLELSAAMLAGALWAGLAAVLKTRGRVHEIFGGLALNNLAIILT